jgi:AcrR family transcriptional regulator
MMASEISGTRERILEIARNLIAEQGYRSASISQIAGRLGTSKAALYYHFKSKEEILDALLSEPLSEFQELVRTAEEQPSGKHAREILGAMIDFVGGPAACLTTFQNDPSVLKDYAKCHMAQLGEDRIIRALAGPRANTAKMVRARVAMAAAKQGTLAALEHGDKRLTPAMREEILGAALRALGVSESEA